MPLLKKFFQNKKVLITLGSTREYLDPVRFLTNASSGKMGLALAQVFRACGARVFLICGSGIHPQKKFRFVSVVSACDMRQEVRKKFSDADIFVACAAVSDYRPAVYRRGKIKRQSSSATLKLVPNPDILEEATRSKTNQLCVGFALEDAAGRNGALKRAREKMIKKRCDLLVLNHPSSMESDFIDATLLFKDGKINKIGRVTKKRCAYHICQALAASQAKN